jgi:parallel beta-helix repeat protein
MIVNNLIGGYLDHGVSISRVNDGYNTVRGNYIGTDTSGLTDIGPGNKWSIGITIESSGFNVIGPENVITNHGWSGVYISGEESVGNTITRNSIHDNGKFGIDLASGGNNQITNPFILDFDLQADSLTGWAYPNSIVEVFSDSSDEGAFYEGQALADSSGFFTFRKESAFTGPYLTATATDPDGNTSEFSLPTNGNSGNFSNQVGNTQVMTALQPKTSSQLPADDRLGTIFYDFRRSDFNSLHSLWNEVINMGAKRVDTQINEFEPPIDWGFSETEIPVEFDKFIDAMNEDGVAVNYLLIFWDKAGHAAGDTLPNPRFSTEQDIQRYLDYVRHIVGYFKGRVQYYSIWGEQGYFGHDGIKGIEPKDYIELSRRTIPVIREVDPQAKVVTGPLVLQHETYHLYPLLRSDVIQLFDVISTHPFFDAAPDNTELYGNYYYEYPSLAEDILQTASAQGFQGEYWGYSLTWMVNELHTSIQAIKYNARGMLMHLGLNYGTGTGPFLNPEREPVLYYTWANLFTFLAGTEPADLGLEIKSEDTNIVSYGFTHTNGDLSLALWTDGAAVDYDPGVTATITIPGVSASRVTSIDVLKFFKQELITEADSSNLIIHNFNVKDYPLIIMLSKSTGTGIPDDNGSQMTFTLHQNFPNPFNPETTIRFRLQKKSNVTLKIFNIMGQEIKFLVNRDYQRGNYSVKWDGTNNTGVKVASGIYFYRMKAGSFHDLKKMILMK